MSWIQVKAENENDVLFLGICYYCGGQAKVFRAHKSMGSPLSGYDNNGNHDDPFDCIQQLNKKIYELEESIKEIKLAGEK